MKNLTARLFLIPLLSLMLFTACEETPVPVPVGPTFEIVDATGFVLDTATVFTDSVFKVKVQATRGDSALTQIEVTENGVAIAASRIKLNGFQAGSNPSPLDASFSGGFNWEVAINAHSDPDVTNTYAIKVSDASGRSSEVSVDITTREPGTAYSEMTMVLLKNKDGPVGQGGLDLHTGVSTGSETDTTDIRDVGIDLTKPLEQNWIQKITTWGNAELRLPDASFQYDDVLYKEQIEAAFGAGTTITTSEAVMIGDQFLVLSEGVYFALIVTDINITPADNADYYEFSVKQ